MVEVRGHVERNAVDNASWRVVDKFGALYAQIACPTSLLVPKSFTRRVQSGFAVSGAEGLNSPSVETNSGVISEKVSKASMSICG